jgi:DNA (cytosine-5)-methyltransferase 1
MSPREEFMQNPRFVSLYTGAGGLDLGFALAGFAPVFSNDIAPDSVQTYSRLMDDIAPALPHVKGEEHRVTSGDIRGVAGLPGEGSAELVIGGPPCQGFSVAGRMDPDDPRSKHVWDFMGMVQRVKPKVFVMENVKALAENARWRPLMEALRSSASELGYATVLHVLDSSKYGVPQARQRMFLVGVSAGIDLPARPSQRSDRVSVRDALAAIPKWGSVGNDGICVARVTPAAQPVLRKSPYAGMLFNGQGRPMDLDRPAPTLPASMGGNRTPILDQTLLDTPEADSWIVNYHAHLLAGGAPVESVPENLRRITVQEAAALQTFPPAMEWVGGQSSRFRQIGNAVPPILAQAVAASVREAMGYAPFDAPSSVLGLPLASAEVQALESSPA